jgi:NADH-quinone oxidoreductase subunit I
MNMTDQRCHPIIDIDRCIWCGECVNVCPNDVIRIDADNYSYTFAWINCCCSEKCKDICPVDAIVDING